MKCMHVSIIVIRSLPRVFSKKFLQQQHYLAALGLGGLLSSPT